MIVEFTAIIIVMFGLIGLGIDGARWMFLRTETAYIADAAASAASRQLKQQAGCGCVAAATAAAQGVVSADITAMADGLTTYSAPVVVFYAALTPTPIVTTDDAAAQFVSVTLSGTTQPVFLSPFAALPVGIKAFD